MDGQIPMRHPEATRSRRFDTMTNRLDQVLVERGLCESRERAKRAIMAGVVKVNEQPARKPSDPIEPGDRIEVVAPEKYVSRGGHKLEHALKVFRIDVTGLSAIDLGASTGGFTDCLLQGGVALVYAVDVGQGQLAWKLRHHSKVAVLEKTNARELTREHFPPRFSPVDLIVIDCSFISLRKIIPAATGLLKAGGRIVALIKPQFEAGRREVDLGGGVITDPSVHRRVVRELEDFVSSLPELRWREVTESPLLGPAGNKEFLVLLERTG